jgi:hypothetical protein
MKVKFEPKKVRKTGTLFRNLQPNDYFVFAEGQACTEYGNLSPAVPCVKVGAGAWRYVDSGREYQANGVLDAQVCPIKCTLLWDYA